MIFYGKKKELVWDEENQKALCVFENGVLETRDKKIIEKLKKLGFKYEVTEQDKTKK